MRSLEPPRIVIIDDHPWVRLGLRSLLEGEGDFQVCGEAEDALQALAMVGELKPQIAIVDISLKGKIDGIELTGMIRECHPEVAVLVLSMHAEPKYAVRALAAGASAYISKSEAPEHLIETLYTILEARQQPQDTANTPLVPGHGQ
jgi:DNA-binding NarL/FixJ family response regulator